jgi:transcription factor C subunit 6
MSRRATARRASAKKRYTLDPFEGIEELQDADSEHSPVRRSRDSDSEDEFVVEADPADAAEDDDDDDDDDGDVSGADVEAEAQSDPASDAGEQDLDDAISIAVDDEEDEEEGDEDDEDRPAGTGRTVPRKPREPLTGPDGLLFNRGLPDSVTRKSGKHDKRLFLFGSSIEEFSAIEKACMKWDGQDTLPIRRKPQETGSNAFDYSYWQGNSARKREEKESWNWYFGLGGKEVFAKRQTTSILSNGEGEARTSTNDAPQRPFLAGPLDTPQLIRLDVGSSVSLKELWHQPQTKGIKATSKYSSAGKAGFILNLGAKIRCTEWVPNQPGSAQYLALSTIQARDIPKGTAPAFTPQLPFVAEVQIWKFTSTPQGSVNSDIAPALKYVLRTKWGDVKSIKWCPAPHKQSSTLAKRPLGLLAGVWGDGGLRVIDLMNQPEPLTTDYILVEKAAFESHPPDTLFTGLAWLSATRIAAGCANGCVAVYDLARYSVTGSIRPVIYTSIASGYILSIAACYPSHQNLLLTTSTDGYPRLTDLNQPDPSTPAATVQAPRSRSTQDIAVWNDFCQNALVMDDNFALKGLPLRRFFTTISLGRARSVGTALATSPCHPFVLIGTAHGEVTGSNPMRRIIQPKVLPLLQTWFTHEWRRPTESEAAGDETGPETIGTHGLSRFLEGQKVEQGQRTYREGTMQNSEDKEHGLHFHTVHEEETAVSSLAWNPNKEYGAWAAAGLADGLVRVEDLAAA